MHINASTIYDTEKIFKYRWYNDKQLRQNRPQIFLPRQQKYFHTTKKTAIRLAVLS